MTLNFVPIAAIVAICYLFAEGFKAIVQNAEKQKRYIPVLCGLCGLLLGLLAYFTHLPLLEAEDPLTAAAIGIASGFAATGVHQVYKQLKDTDKE